MLAPPRDVKFASNNKNIEQITNTTKRFQLCQQQQKDFISINNSKKIFANSSSKRFHLFQHHQEISTLLATTKGLNNFASTIKRFQLHQQLQRDFNFISSNKRFSTLPTPPRDFNFASTTKNFNSTISNKNISTLPIVAKIFQFYKQ